MQQIVTHLVPASGHPQAMGIEREDFGARHLVVLALRSTAFEYKGHQEKRGSFGSVGVLHRFGVPALAWACRTLLQPDYRRVFGYRFAFRRYHPLDGCGSLPARAGMTCSRIPAGSQASAAA